MSYLPKQQKPQATSERHYSEPQHTVLEQMSSLLLILKLCESFVKSSTLRTAYVLSSRSEQPLLLFYGKHHKNLVPALVKYMPSWLTLQTGPHLVHLVSLPLRCYLLEKIMKYVHEHGPLFSKISPFYTPVPSVELINIVIGW